MQAKILTLFIFLVACSQSTPLSSLHGLSQRLINQYQFRLPKQVLGITLGSVIPLFFEDLRHPWIQDEHNIALLKKQRNAAFDICEISDSSRGSLGGLDIPSDIFDRLDLDNNRAGIHREGWSNLHDRLKEMSSCPAALQQVQHLYIDVYRHEWEPELPGNKTGELLADVLSSMTNLQKIHWQLPSSSNSFFEEIFTRKQLQLTSVSHLDLDAEAKFMVSVCPNIGSLREAMSYSIVKNATRILLDAATTSHNLKALSVGRHEGGWTPELVHKIAASVPSLTNLSMIGNIWGIWPQQYPEFETQDYFEYKTLGDPSRLSARIEPVNAVFKSENELEGGLTRKEFPRFLSLLYALKELNHLTDLSLPEAPDLGLGFDGGPMCGNAYMGPEGHIYGRSISKQRIETVEKAASMTMAILPGLQNICIGNTCPVDFERNEQSQIIRIKWEWTDRVDEYLLELWPERPDTSYYRSSH